MRSGLGTGAMLGAVGEPRRGYFLDLLIGCWPWWLGTMRWLGAGDDEVAQPQVIGAVLGSAARGAEVEGHRQTPVCLCRGGRDRGCQVPGSHLCF